VSFTNVRASVAVLFVQLLKSTSPNQTQRDSALNCCKRIITVFWESRHTDHEKKESRRENLISYHTKCKVTTHSNSQEKFGINEKKITGWGKASHDHDCNMASICGKPLSSWHDVFFLNSMRTVRQIVMRYYENKLRKKVNRKAERESATSEKTEIMW